jgi:hypothetical protein
MSVNNKVTELSTVGDHYGSRRRIRLVLTLPSFKYVILGRALLGSFQQRHRKMIDR